MTPDVASVTAYLLGEHGGLFGLGALIGGTFAWFWCERTVLKLTRQQVLDAKTIADSRDAECNRRITHLENENKDLWDRLASLQERYTGGLERTIAQQYVSSYRVLNEGQEQTYEVDHPPRRPRKPK